MPISKPQIRANGEGIVRSMIQNGLRASGIVWRERKWLMIAVLIVFTAFSFTPFLQSGTRALLINGLVALSRGESLAYPLPFLLVLLVVAAIIPAVLAPVRDYLSKSFWFFLQEKFDLLILEKRATIDVATHEDPRTNDLFMKVSDSGVWRIANTVERQLYITQNVIEVVIASAIIVAAEWWVFLLVFLGTIPELVVEGKYGRDIWGIWGDRAERKRRYFSMRGHFERTGSLIELKLFQNIPYFLKNVGDLFRAFQKEEKANERKKLARAAAALILSQAAVAAAIVWFVYEVVRGNLQIGTLTFVIASMGDLRQSLSGLFMNLARQYQDNLFVSDIFSLLDLPAAIPKPKRGVTLDRRKTPDIVFERVTFSYPGADRPALRDISLKISPGEKIAFIGLNGAGKTTLVKLLARFYDPDRGRITVGGHDLREVDLESWYGMLGAIFQDYAQYRFPVKEAVAVGDTKIPLNLGGVKRAAKASEADTFIGEWKEGYEQMLGKEFSGGVEPSIGQWQKLALARTFYRDPRVLILDEPTSSIDAEAEAKIFERLEALPRDRTVILISHRFSTVRHADKIYVIEDGAISESGTHEKLLVRRRTYARLFNLQAKGYR